MNLFSELQRFKGFDCFLFTIFIFLENEWWCFDICYSYARIFMFDRRHTFWHILNVLVFIQWYYLLRYTVIAGRNDCSSHSCQTWPSRSLENIITTWGWSGWQRCGEFLFEDISSLVQTSYTMYAYFVKVFL